MSRPSSLLRDCLAPYASPIDLHTSSSTPYTSKQLHKYHGSTKPSERLSILLSLAEHAFNRADAADALTFYSAALSAFCSYSSDVATAITILRRVGECHHQLEHFSLAVSAFDTAVSLLSSLPSSSSTTQRLVYEVHLSLGNAFLDWADVEDSSLKTSYSRVLRARQDHQLSVHAARQLAGVGKEGKGKGMTASTAAMLMRANINLGNAMVQLLHFDHYELEGRRRMAASAVTDSSSSSVSPPCSPPSSAGSRWWDPLDAPVDESLSVLPSSVLQQHRSRRFHSGSALFEAALALAVSHGKQADERMVWENTATLHEAVRDYSSAADCYHHADPTWQWHIQAMNMWMRAQRWDDAMREAQAVKAQLSQGRKISREERENALDELNLVTGMWRHVQTKDTLMRDIERVQEESESNEEGHRSTEKPLLQRHISLLHQLARVCVFLAQSGVGVQDHWTAALSAHQQAIALLSTTPSPSADLLAAVHGYHVWTVIRYLPYLMRMRLDQTELTNIVTPASHSIPQTPALVRSLFHVQLQFQCGQPLPEALSTLRGVEVEGQVLRREVLRMREEIGEAGKTESVQGSEEWDMWDREQRTAREELSAVERWIRQNSQEAHAEKRWLTHGLWLLTEDDDDEEEDDVVDDEAMSVSDDSLHEVAAAALDVERAPQMEFGF